MSDTPPDRDEASTAPEAPKNPWVGWLVWAILLPVLYVLSSGPMYWLAMKGYLPESLGGMYAPLGYLPDDIVGLIVRYMGWWNR